MAILHEELGIIDTLLFYKTINKIDIGFLITPMIWNLYFLCFKQI